MSYYNSQNADIYNFAKYIIAKTAEKVNRKGKFVFSYVELTTYVYRKKYFPFLDSYAILRKTSDIARPKKAQRRFWIRRRDDSSQDKSCFSISDRGYGPNEDVDV